MSNLGQIGLALHMYAQENDGVFPDKLSRLYPRYMPSHTGLEIFICPYTDDKITRSEQIDENTSYIYVSGLTEEDASDAVLAYDKPGNHKGKSSPSELFVDGTVKSFEDVYGLVRRRLHGLGTTPDELLLVAVWQGRLGLRSRK